ncbi:hypothetical protein ACLGI4_11420 [Streptomyces sp. HMX112]|uniref:hypothetical protein n=1 Tax=Streptomyces sp. HMX112 TaxID=3390850 RepID=UPI003A7FC991
MKFSRYASPMRLFVPGDQALVTENPGGPASRGLHGREKNVIDLDEWVRCAR